MHAKQSTHTQYQAYMIQHLTNENGGAHRATTSPEADWEIVNPPGIPAAPSGIAQVRQFQSMVQDTKTVRMALNGERDMRQYQPSKLQGPNKMTAANVQKQDTQFPNITYWL